MITSIKALDNAIYSVQDPIRAEFTNQEIEDDPPLELSVWYAFGFSLV